MDNREFPTIGVQKMDPMLYKAAMEGNVQDLTSIMEANDPQAPNLTLSLTPQKNTVLHIAIEFGHQNIVDKVIQLCPSLIYKHNSKGDTPLHVAASAGRLDLTKLLTPALNLNTTEGNPDLVGGIRQAGGVALRMRNSEGSNAIHEALKKSHREVALHLLAFEEEHHELAFEEGHHKLARVVNNAGESLLYLAAEAGLDEVVQKIIDSGDYSTSGPDGQNPLHIAVIKGQLGVVKILLDKERNFIPQADRFGNTALHYASATSYRRILDDEDEDEDEHRPWSQGLYQRKILKRLLEADQSLAYVPNRNGDFPLFIAIRKNFDWAVDTILEHYPDSAELVNKKGQNALHLAVMEKNWFVIYCLKDRLECKKLINEPDNDGNTPMHLATLTNQHDIVRYLIRLGPPDLTMSNKQGLTAMDICGYKETEHPIRGTLRRSGAVPGRHRWQERFPSPPPRPPPPRLLKIVRISPEFKVAIQTLPIVTTLVAAVTFAAAFTVPGGYNNDGPHEGLPVFMRNAALQAFVLSDILAFCSSMVATILLVYANAHSEDAFLISSALKTCYYISGVAILATITAFVTAVYVLTSKESLWLAVTSLILGSAVPILLLWYKNYLEVYKLMLLENEVEYKFVRDYASAPKLNLEERIEIQAERIERMRDSLTKFLFCSSER